MAAQPDFSHCPECQGALENDNLNYRCSACAAQFKARAHCDRCDAELERLKACGAVDYFCNTCNEMKSKSTLVWKLNKQS